MWLFIPAMANWIRTRPPERASNSGRHACGTERRAASASYAFSQRQAKRTSRSAIVSASRNGVEAAPGSAMIAAMRSVTVRYMRLNTATPSLSGSSASISRIRATTPSTVVGRLTVRVWAVARGRLPGTVGGGP